MTREEIKEYIPHREPMLLIDEIDIDQDHVGHAKYTIRENEFFLQGHFPGHTVVPGVILCEIMAQACSLLVGEFLKGRTPFYAGIENVKFKSSVFPGDTFETTARIVNRKGMMFFIEAVGKVGDKVCVKGNLSFALIDNDKVKEMR